MYRGAVKSCVINSVPWIARDDRPVKLATHLHLVPRLTMRGALPHSPHRPTTNGVLIKHMHLTFYVNDVLKLIWCVGNCTLQISKATDGWICLQSNEMFPQVAVWWSSRWLPCQTFPYNMCIPFGLVFGTIWLKVLKYYLEVWGKTKDWFSKCAIMINLVILRLKWREQRFLRHLSWNPLQNLYTVAQYWPRITQLPKSEL